MRGKSLCFFLRVYLKTPNAPGQRAFLRCATSFFLEIRQYSREKMSCTTQKSLAAGHIMRFQIHPRCLTSCYNRPIIKIVLFMENIHCALIFCVVCA